MPLGKIFRENFEILKFYSLGFLGPWVHRPLLGPVEDFYGPPPLDLRACSPREKINENLKEIIKFL